MIHVRYKGVTQFPVRETVMRLQYYVDQRDTTVLPPAKNSFPGGPKGQETSPGTIFFK